MFKHTAYYTVARIRFEFRKSKIHSDKGTIGAKILIEGQRSSPLVTTTIRTTRADWDARRSPRANHLVQQLNKKLLLWEESIYSAAKTLYDQGEIITARTLLDEKNKASRCTITLEQVYVKYVEFKKSQVGADSAQQRLGGQICKGTFRTYENRWLYVRKFLKEMGIKRMFAHKADAPFVQTYYNWLQTNALAPNTATKYAKLLTEVLQWGVRQGLVKDLQVIGFRGSGQVEKPPHNVTEEEVLRIEALELNDSKMEGIRDGWLLARELCLHYSDYADLRPEHFYKDDYGRWVFEKARQKQESGRNIQQTAVVSQRALSIWQRYCEKIPRSCNNAEFNLCLKEIGHWAGLEEPLRFSHARDSGIFRWVTSGVPDMVTRLAAGWRKTDQMMRYINLDRRLLNELTAPKMQGGPTSSTPITGTPFSKTDGAVNADGGKGQRYV